MNGEGVSHGWRRKLHGVRTKRQLIAVLHFLLCYPPVPRKHYDWLLVLYGYIYCNLKSTVCVKKVVPLFILAAELLFVHCTVNPQFLYYKRGSVFTFSISQFSVDHLAEGFCAVIMPRQRFCLWI